MMIVSILFACLSNEPETTDPVDFDLDGDGFSVGQGDCNDNDANIAPSSPDLFGDSFDQNCDGVDGIDQDGDGFASVTSGGTDCNDEDPTVFDVDQDGDGESMCDGDCDDLNGLLNHWDQDGDGQSACDGDCDDTNPYIFVGAAPADDVTLCMKDKDGDGYGDAAQIDFVEPGTDCDDDDEFLNGLDFDGDGQSSCGGDCDDFDPQAFMGMAILEPSTDCTKDVDGDGYGDIDVEAPLDPGVDCDDNDAWLTELDQDGDGFSTCDGDCDDNNPLLELTDFDFDGYSTCDGDCDDTSLFIYPGAAEFDSDIICMRDADGDGYGDDDFYNAGTDCNDSSASLTPLDSDGDGYSTCQGDCDDGSNSTYPGSAYVDFPQDCVLDFDLDGYASVTLGGTDCNDFDPNVNPFQIDVIGDNIDRNCDGHDGDDSDGDGQASIASGGVDCNDTDLLIHDLDVDGDGLGICSGDCDDSTVLLNQLDQDGDGFTTCNGDCDDTNVFMYPGAAELDSVTACLEDADEDGYGNSQAFNVGSDCDDSTAGMNQLDVDGDGYTSCAGDCNDGNPNIFPMMVNGVVTCDSPQISILVQDFEHEFELGCSTEMALVVQNIGSSDLQIDGIAIDQPSIATLDTLNSVQGSFPWSIAPNDLRTIFVNPEDLSAGTYTFGIEIESDSVLNSQLMLDVDLEVLATTSQVFEITVGTPEPLHFVLVPEVLPQGSTLDAVWDGLGGVMAGLQQQGHTGTVTVLTDATGCVGQNSFPMDATGISNAEMTLMNVQTISGSSLDRLNLMLTELNGGCNDGIFSTTDRIVPVVIGNGTESNTPQEISSLSSTQSGWNLHHPVVFHDANGTCGYGNFVLTQNWVEGQDGLVLDICTADSDDNYWSAFYRWARFQSGSVPVPDSIWTPSFEVSLNTVSLANGWQLGNSVLEFSTPPLSGDVIEIAWEEMGECP